MSVNNFESGGIEHVRIIQLNWHFPMVKVWGEYYTSVRIIFKFLWYTGP